MKKLVLTMLLALPAASAFAQATVNINTTSSRCDLRAFDEGAGTWAAGTNYSVALYWGGSNDPLAVTNFVPGLAWFTTGITAGYVMNSTGGGQRSIWPMLGGSLGWFQIKAWTGGYPTFEAAQMSGDPAVRLATGPIAGTYTGDPSQLDSPPSDSMGRRHVLLYGS